MLSGGFDLNDFLFRAIAFLIAITVHELGHAFVAYSFGDPTPKRQGRITLNPIAHLDLLGTLMILFGPFGWAKPVSFNPYNFKGNKRVAKILTTLAGPVMNLIVAVLFAFLFATYLHSFQASTSSAWDSFWVNFFLNVIQLNLILFLFNLIPIPPLDGFWIVADLLPNSVSEQLYAVAKYGPFILLLAIYLGVTSKVMFPAYYLILDALMNLFGIQ
ncbi:MAG: site-2 protease family protein [Tumebacillaceae bacterium]